MLHIFRKKQRPILWVILGVIIITFIWFYGRGGKVFQNARQAQPVGKLGEKIITQEDLNRAIRGTIIYLKVFLKYPPELIPNPDDLKQEGWRRIVEVAQAKKDGITVGDQEIRNIIEKLFFGKSGNFNPAYYKSIVRQIGGAMTPREFEEHIRESLLIDKLKRYLSSAAIVTDDDLAQEYQVEKTLMKLAYVPFYYSNYFKGQAVATNEIEEFFYTNQEDFRVPPQVQISYAMVKTAPDKVVIEDEEVQEYYDDNKEKFADTNEVVDTETEVQEYIPFDDVKQEIKEQLLKERALEQAYDKLEELYFAMGDSSMKSAEEKAKAFKANAEKLKIEAGETDWISLEDEIQGVSNSYAIIRAALSSEEGALHDLQQISDDTYLMFLVKGKRDTYLPELEEEGVKELVKEEIIKRRALNIARQSAEQLRQQITASKKDFISAAKALGYKPQETVPLEKSSGIQKIGCPAEIVSRLFAFPKNAAVVVPFISGYMLACPTEYYDADLSLMYGDEKELKNKIFQREAGMLINSWVMQGAKKLQVKQQPRQEQPME